CPRNRDHRASDIRAPRSACRWRAHPSRHGMSRHGTMRSDIYRAMGSGCREFALLTSALGRGAVHLLVALNLGGLEKAVRLRVVFSARAFGPKLDVDTALRLDLAAA